MTVLAPVFRTWTTGEVVRASYFNSNIRDAGNWFLAVPLCEVRQTIGQSIANNTSTSISFDTTDIDTAGGHFPFATDTYSCQSAGRYQISGAVSYVFHTDSGARQVEIRVNSTPQPGTDACEVGFSADNVRLSTRVRQLFLNLSDAVQIWTYQTSGGSLNTFVAVGWAVPSMSVRWVGTT